MKKINVFVYNNCDRDARVLKEAKSLTDAGYQVRIVAVLDNRTVPYEKRYGFEIFRIKRTALHIIIMGFISASINVLNIIILFPFRMIYLAFMQPKQMIKQRISERHERTGLILYILNVFSILKHPTSYSSAQFFKKILYKRNSFLRVVTFLAGVSTYPFFMVLRFLLGSVNSIERDMNKFLKHALMPFHRQWVFKDYYKKAAMFCEENPSEILHFHDLHTLPIIDYLPANNKYLKVYDSHELYTEISGLNERQRRKYRSIEKKKIKQVNKVITVNKSIAKELANRYQIEEPEVIMNCPPMFTFSSKRGLENKLEVKTGILEKPVFIYQGGYAPGRGLETLIQAMPLVKKGTLVMMGWGPIENELISLKDSLGLGSKVIFTEPVGQHELLEYTMGADVGIIPYQFVGLNNYYTSPNKLFEYIQAGIAVVGSNFPELVRLIEGYKIGSVFNPEDPEELAKALGYFYNNPDFLNQCKENTKLAANDFNWENEGGKLIKIYNSLHAQVER